MVQAMILLAAMPSEFDSLSATILNTTTATNLTFNHVRDGIVAESQRRQAVKRPQQDVANKISAVKRKGANPKWQAKQKQPESGDKTPESQQQKQRPRGCCAGKKVKGKQVERHQGHLTAQAFAMPEN